jgi:hypothetical protein
MALKLKKAFQLDKTIPEAKQLAQLETDIQVSAMMMNTVKKELVDAVNQRNEILRDTLLHQYDYILASTDKVLFMGQTSEIRIYDSNGTTQREIHKEKE